MSETDLFYAQSNPIDPLANLVTLEPHVCPVRPTRLLKPDFGLFFTDSVALFSVANNNELTPLTRNVHYRFVEFQDLLTQQSGREVCAALLLLGSALPVDLKISYQAYGGVDNANLLAVATALSVIPLKGFQVEWASILDLPRRFAPSSHLHDILDIYGLDLMVEPLNRIMTASVTGHQEEHRLIYVQLVEAVTSLRAAARAAGSTVHDHIDSHENHHQVTKAQVGLGNLDNRGFKVKLESGIMVWPYCSPKSVRTQLDTMITEEKLLALFN